MRAGLLFFLVAARAASATTGFDATRPAASFSGDETWTVDGDVKLWSLIERLEDPDRLLFTQEQFNGATAWPADAWWAPHIDTCFGTSTPHSALALLHMGPRETIATGTPILFVPGAGDNASRGFITMATHMDELNRPVYALTFAHPHGDVFMQAELVADAIARIKERTGAAQVDLVAHSKGGIAATLYTSNHAAADWGSPAYSAAGTRYRGDVRRLVLIAAPMSGIDTAFRWPNMNLFGLEADTALAPTSWNTWYPYGAGLPSVNDSLVAQDFLASGGDLFPGHRQLLARQPYPLPGSQSSLDGYALQTDWYTTYEGGTGFFSKSDGIDAAIAAGGDLIARLATSGVDPGVDVYLLAGTHPLMPNGTDELSVNLYNQTWSLPDATAEDWGAFVDGLVEGGWIPHGFEPSELQGLADGKLVLGEVTGVSDGLVFASSASFADGLIARGASVVDSHTADLSHLDLLYASPITGELLIEASTASATDGWMAAWGARYSAEDTIGWLEAAVADPASPPDTGDTGTPTDTGDTGDTEGPAETGPGETDPDPDPDPVDTAAAPTGADPVDTGVLDYRPCGGCAAGGRSASMALALAAAVATTRRRRA
jgi:pimeloyl-ACP methyl ester carboxylesterase